MLSNDKIRIAILGVGGGGCNTVNRMARQGMKSAKTIAINTDSLHLRVTQADKRILIGKSITNGLGAGGFPEIAEKCAQASKSELREMIGENELVFLATGLGGGTGTGASPVIAEIAKEQGAIVVSIVTTPFSLERARVSKAQWGLERLAEVSDTVVVIDNNKLVSYAPNIPINDAFNLADAITAKAVRGITETIMEPSLMNIDYADVKAVMENGGISLISIGEGSGNEKIERVSSSALEHPLLDVSYEGAKGALLHIEGGMGLTLGEVIEVGEKITSKFDPNANIKIGARLMPKENDSISATAIVTGLQSEQVSKFLQKKQEAQQKRQELSTLENINYI
ncbi:cell division protein FtsZ [Candidatus Micrarchaeota archaeon CG10_big_fil_rev_8_21_14_0_10_45_29]|nr:MAG: cell division protein FtsZ [Candidatus Micrarchaeota archaeon CG10_big_fil_rev_8_21_14_0_10_45_29]